MLTQPSLMTQAMVTQIDNGQTGQNNVVSIYFSNTDLSAFSGGLMSSFTSNLLSGSAQSVMMSTYYNAANAAYSGTLMKMSTFTGLGVAQGGPAINVAGPFSTTVRYDVTFGSGAGTTNDTVNLVAVPEPASWALMIVGFGLMGGALRSRKTKVAFA
ncbi:MAG: PEP-CTERM sorting domain-containing protein [Sphingomonas sp.]|nr:PEP-CTERM sorting domain-containing protein [Sphingomonas sp.]